MSEDTQSLDIAVIGMSARYAQADDYREYFNNLLKGKDCITRDQDKSHGSFIGAYGKVDNIDCFDAGFFGMNTREASNADPQQRLLLEEVYHALEDAGYNSFRCDQKIGLYTSTEEHLYIWNYLMQEKGDWFHNYHMSKLNLDGTFNTLVAYKFNLQGPCMLSNYACASSLGAIHIACQGLLNYECDIAVAGGVSLEPEQEGYYCFDATASRQGYVRTFDAQADGYVEGGGIGLVVLKRLEDAKADHDHIVAVIKGTAANNDGNRKAGFPAPSVQGQQEAILDALMVSGVEPADVGYMETHGTATVLGDTVELSALKRVFKSNPNQLLIGSVKPNIGHTGIAAGAANLIKASLILQNGIIPPSIHCKDLNDELLEENCPLKVNDILYKWNSEGSRTAGVSAFGMGGANVIAILQDYKMPDRNTNIHRKELFLFSAKTEASLKDSLAQFMHYLEDNPVPLQDAAYTLQTGRGEFDYRLSFSANNQADLQKSLAAAQKKLPVRLEPNQRKQVVFAFSGTGSQGSTIGNELYQHHPVYRQEMEICFSLLKKLTGRDFKEPFFKYKERREVFWNDQLTGGLLTFITGYSLARTWISHCGIPDIIMGHSMGEYIGACISGVFTLEEALTLLIKRTELFEQLPEGNMMAIAAPADRIRPLLTNGVTISAYNGEKRVLVSGNVDNIRAFANVLVQNGISYSKLDVKRAGHCHEVDPICQAFSEVLKDVEFKQGKITMLSTCTADYIKNGETAAGEYWLEQMRAPVRFHDAVLKLTEQQNLVIIEIGNSDQLTSLVKKVTAKNKTGTAIASMLDGRIENSWEGFLGACGRVWELGVNMEWMPLYDELPYRIPLPGYRFEKKSYWRYKKRYYDGENRFEVPTEEKAADVTLADDKTEPFRNEMDKKITGIFRDLLSQPELSIFDDLFEYGFDSLATMMAAAKIESLTGKSVTMKEIYQITTIAELSDLISEKELRVLEPEPEEEPVKAEIKDLENLFEDL
ncbi:MAG: acyltransferase domain-containing protein [Hungatella sp.]|jgi:acyl transferase domain-containing protein|nr:acyltransferase domain-containing protein [Hungatella sp.]